MGDTGYGPPLPPPTAPLTASVIANQTHGERGRGRSGNSDDYDDFLARDLS